MDQNRLIWCPGFRIKLADVYGCSLPPIWNPRLWFNPIVVPESSNKSLSRANFVAAFHVNFRRLIFLVFGYKYIYIYIVRDYPAKSKPQNVQGSCHGSLP